MLRVPSDENQNMSPFLHSNPMRWVVISRMSCKKCSGFFCLKFNLSQHEGRGGFEV